MNNLWTKFKALSLTWKLILIGAVLVVALLIFDASTGYVRQFKNYMFDRRQAQIEQQNTELLAQNEKLRAEQKVLVEQAIAAKAKEAIFAEREKALDAKSKDELAKTNQALEEQSKVEAETAEPTDPYTQCVRTKEKLMVLKLPSATKINCEDLKPNE